MPGKLHALAIGRRHSARRQRIAPFDLRRASRPVSAAISIMFLDTLCSKKWYDMPHIECGIHSLQLIGMRVVFYKL